MATVQIPGAATLNEGLVHLQGIVGSCNEAAQLILAHLYTGVPLGADTLTQLILWMQAHGLATAGGVTHTDASGGQALAHLGVPNHVEVFNGDPRWAQYVADKIKQGIPVSLGLNNAGNGWHGLIDQLTGQSFDAGVGGHEIAIVGYVTDQTGKVSRWIVADPNVAYSGAHFVQYTTADLQRAGVMTAVVPNAAPTGGGSGTTLLDSGGGNTSGSQQGQGNPFIDLTGLAAAITGLPGAVADSIKAAFTGPLVRIGLVTLGILLLVVGVLVIFFGKAVTEGPEEAEQIAAPAAAAAA